MIDSCIKRFIHLNINLLALDFDQTMIDIHTGGRWKGTAEELQEHVRSEFHMLLQACCDHNINIAIVTFSGQTQLVKAVVEKVVGPQYMATHVVVRGRDRTWSYQGVGTRAGKQAFIASAVEELEHKMANRMTADSTQTLQGDSPAVDSEGQTYRILKNTTVLVDDDATNIRVALEDGTRAVWFNPSKPYRILQDLAQLV